MEQNNLNIIFKKNINPKKKPSLFYKSLLIIKFKKKEIIVPFTK